MSKKVSVLLWLYHENLSEEFYRLLHPYKNLIDIHLGLCKDNSNRMPIKFFGNIASSITYHDNFGADVWPFLQQLQGITTPVFIKLHSKNSKWGTSGHGNWRLMLVDGILSSPRMLMKHALTMQCKNIGYFGCRGFMCDDFETTNTDKIEELISLLNLLPIKKRVFCAGNMFMGNTKLFQKTFSGHYDQLYELLSQETGKVSDTEQGTYCHSLERIFGYLSNNDQYKSASCYIDTIKIKVLSQKDYKYLHFRRLPNNHIYCTEQPNIYGYIARETSKSFFVKWFHQISEDQKYNKISKNTYINSKHMLGV